MKRCICASALLLLITTLAYSQQSPGQGASAPNQTPAQSMPPGLQNRDQLPPGLQNRDQLPPGLDKRTNDNANAQMNQNYGTQNNFGATSNGVGNQLSQTGRESGTTNQSGASQGQFGANTQINASVQLQVNAVTATDRPIATQVQQVLLAEPVLAQTFPMLRLSVNNGVIILDGDVQCGAERVLIETLCRDRLPRTVRIENRLRPPGGAFAPATVR